VKTMRSVVAALCVAAASAAVPSFPLDWQAITSDSILINQGGQVNADGSVCCAPNAPQCKIQTAYEIGRQYFAYTKNLTAMKAPDNSGVVTDFNAGKEYQVDGTGKCTAFCPLPNRESELFPFAIDPNATFVGTVPCGDQMCQHYQSVTVIPILNITMEATEFYVAKTASGAYAPVYIVQDIEPLGEQIGDENQTFAQWEDMTNKAFPADAFTVTGADSCPQAQQCAGDDDGQAPPEGVVATYFTEQGVAYAGNERSKLFAEVAARYRAAQAAKQA